MPVALAPLSPHTTVVVVVALPAPVLGKMAAMLLLIVFRAHLYLMQVGVQDGEVVVTEPLVLMLVVAVRAH